MSVFVCDVCCTVVRDPYQRIEWRIELRKVRTMNRYRTRVERHLCLTCADRLFDAGRPVQNSSQQQVLL